MDYQITATVGLEDKQSKNNQKHLNTGCFFCSYICLNINAVDIKIDADGIAKTAQKLADLKKNYFPAAVRNTLYALATDMRNAGGTIQESADGSFAYKRSATFMRSIIWAEYAKGNDVNKMQSGAGIGEKSNGKDRVSKRMEAQESGGTLRRGYTPTKGARRGDLNSQIKGDNRHGKAEYEDVNNDLVSFKGNELQKRLYKAAKGKEYVRVKGRKKGRIMIAKMTGTSTTYREFSGTRNGKHQFRGAITGFKYNMRFLYSYNEGKTVKIKATHFVREAGMQSLKKTEEFFNKAAKEQFERAFNNSKK